MNLFVDQSGQRGGREWLVQKADAERLDLRTRNAIGVSSHARDRLCGAQRSQRGRERRATHLRHGDVAQHECDATLRPTFVAPDGERVGERRMTPLSFGHAIDEPRPAREIR